MRELDRRAIHEHGIPGYTLMQRAAAFSWRSLHENWPQARRLAVFCGAGNNGGDGYEIARLAQRNGCEVYVYEVSDQRPAGDAATARAAWLAQGAVLPWREDSRLGQDCELVVDAIFGTGLSRAPEASARAAIAEMNRAHATGVGVFAVDLPSGLQSDTGAELGSCVRADLTASFIGRKLGLYTGQGPACAGRVVFDDLGVPASVYESLPALAQLLDAVQLRRWLPPRPRTAHKGDHGHVLVIGGNQGMVGAAVMAGRAALRAGAGLVSVATRTAHAALLAAAQPELMSHGVESSEDLQALIERADVVAIGPGLGQNDWAQAARAAALTAGKPLVVDADALNLLARSPQRRSDWVLTPHPGEAARLLAASVAAVQCDRLAAVRELRARYGGVCVLKGAGTVVQGVAAAVCPYGNPGMAVGGMGDALTGVIAALIAQGLDLEQAARAGVMVHALAGDGAAQAGERGLLPSDLIEALRGIVNPGG